MRVGELLRCATAELRGAGIGSARLDAELLLAEVLGFDRLRLMLERDRRVLEAERGRFEELVARRRLREPVAYVLGRKEFWGLELAVGPGVLVPRPETELLVEQALARFGRRAAATVVDLCCGAAPLAVALGLELRPQRLIAVDVSVEALGYARQNVRRHGLHERVLLLGGDLMEPLCRAALGPVDLIVSNPPYIPTEELERSTMPEVHRFEPRLALDGGPSGLEISERILTLARDWLAPGGAVLVETGAGLMPRLVEVACRAGFRRLEVLHDLAGTQRALWAEEG